MVNDIIIYTRKTCPYCVNLIKVLDSRGVSYQNVDIDQSEEPVEEAYIDENGHTPVPQVLIGEKLIYDYDTEESLVDEIEDILKKK